MGAGRRYKLWSSKDYTDINGQTLYASVIDIVESQAIANIHLR
jgi:hypothetical protein